MRSYIHSIQPLSCATTLTRKEVKNAESFVARLGLFVLSTFFMAFFLFDELRWRFIDRKNRARSAREKKLVSVRSADDN